MNRWVVLLGLVAGVFLLHPGMTVAKTGINNTKHNLSVTGPGDLKALTETRICVFCHTPHNATPGTPLWNKAINPINYALYSSSTLAAKPWQPNGPTRLCLSCHDGTIALGAVLNPTEGIAMTGTIVAGRSSYFGTVLTGHHPVSFSYYDSLPNPELYPAPPAGLNFYGGGGVHCTTCHDPHDNTYKKFLVMDNTNGALCMKCHVMQGWTGSMHSISGSTWNSALPDPWPNTGPNTDFNWTTVSQNACEGCHTPHSAGGKQRLLYYQAEEQNCYPCHNGNVALKNIYAQFQKPFRHQVEATTIGLTANYHDPTEPSTNISGHVECVDCHNAHAVNANQANPPYASGRLAQVKGADMNNSPVNPVVYEYQVCFKCHADSDNSIPYVPRVINNTNTRLAFSTSNASYHPVVGQGRSMDVPSIPSTYMPAMTASSVIYCMDCHESDESPAIGGIGPRGPHGSIYNPLIREQYLTADNTPESYQSYALCYRCHDRNSIMSNITFKKHSTHVVNDHAPCSACHDPHGVKTDPVSGDHIRLMNFDTRIVTPAPGNVYPLYKSLGSRTGSCTLVCHGVTHTNFTY